MPMSAYSRRRWLAVVGGRRVTVSQRQPEPEPRATPAVPSPGTGPAHAATPRPAVAAPWLQGWRADSLAALLLLCATLAFFAPVLRGQTFSAVSRTQAILEPWHQPGEPLPRQYPQSDQADTFYPWIVFTGRALRGGELPLWDPYSFGGHPFFANGETNLLYPPRLILTRAFSASWAQDLFLLLHVWISGVTMRLFLRRLGVGQIAATFGATVWMFNSFTLGWLLLGHIAAITALLPLALLLARDAAGRRSAIRAAWLGAILGLMILGSNILMTLVAWLTVGAYFGSLLLWEGWRTTRGARHGRSRAILALLGLPLLTALVGLGISAVQLLPTLELAGQGARVPPDYARYLRLWRVGPGDLRAIVLPDLIATDRTLNNGLWFVGWLPLALAPFALARRAGRWWLLAALTLAPYVVGTPLTWLGTQFVPGLAYFRPLGRMLFVWALALAIGGALGYDMLARLLIGRWPTLRRPIAGLGILITLLTATQLIGYGRAINPPFQPRTTAALYPHTPLIERLLAEGPDARIAMLRTINGPESWAPPMFAGSVPQSLELRTVGGYESLLPAHEADFWRVVRGEEIDYVLNHPVEDAIVLNYYPRRVRSDLLPTLGVNLIAAVPDVTPEWLAANWPTLRVEPIYRDDGGWIYRLPDARPVAYPGYAVESIPDERAALARVTDRQPDDVEVVQGPNGAALGLPAGGRCEGANRTAQPIAVQSANTVTIRTTSACAGLLILNHSWAPGWTATVDGRATPVLRANALARGVVVPAGSHKVRLTYAPRSFFIGLILTGLTIIGLLAITLGRRGKRPFRRTGPGRQTGV